jgi:two-component system KDP operon response regulator KdpE
LQRKTNEVLKLTATEFNLLWYYLQKTKDRVLTHQYILKEIWGVGSSNGNSIFASICRNASKKKIEDNPNQPKHIITESGVGYRFQ